VWTKPLKGNLMAMTDNVSGQWFMDGDRNRPCAIFQHGRVLLLVNEGGALGTGRVEGDNHFNTWPGAGWQGGLTGELHDAGKTIMWRQNNTKWTR
jgi:hypothetical protein